MKIKRIVLILFMIFYASNHIQYDILSSQSGLEKQMITEIQNLIPLSIQMIDHAIEILSGKPVGMSPEEQELFNHIFDPGDTGSIDRSYYDVVEKNYIRIRQRLESNLKIAFAPNSSSCQGMRLYYTNFIKIYVCPYFLEEDSSERKARTLIHEVAHMALLVVDRSYYDPKSYSVRYHSLTPRGPFYTEFPLIGHILREIQRSDTLYHPDAYAWFAGLSSII